MFEANKGPFCILTGSTMVALTSSEIGLQNQVGFSAQLYFNSAFANGAATGSFKLQACNKPKPNDRLAFDFTGSARNNLWTDVAGIATIAVSGGNGSAVGFFNVADAYYERARIVYTPNVAFTGSAEIWVYAKG